MNRPAIHTILRDELANPLRSWTDPGDETSLAELGAGPIDLIVISMAIEDEFDIVVHDHEVTAETTVGELCALVAREVGKAI